MDFENKSPGFTAEGVEPPASLKSGGFQAGYKPPAAYFTWFWTKMSKIVDEIHTKMQTVALSNLTNISDDTFRDKAKAAGVAGIPIIDAYSSDGIAYTAEVPGLKGLTNGMMITIVPNITSASKTPTLNVNGTGAKMVRLPLSFNNAAMATPKLDTYFTSGRPITLQFDANYIAGGIWKTMKQRTSAQDLYGTLPIEGGGTGGTTADEAIAALGILNKVYPVGSIYITMSDIPPSELFGGTWERIRDKFLLAAGSIAAMGTGGGEEKHTLTVEELPAHSHYAGNNAEGDTASTAMRFNTAAGLGSSAISRKEVAEDSNSSIWVLAQTSGGYDNLGQTLSTAETGGGLAHNNMPPYLAVYMWKRIA